MSNTTNAPKTPAKRTRKATPKGETIEHSAAIAAFANAKGIDTTKAGKLFRARLRSNADVLKANGVEHAKNTPWPALPRTVVAAIFHDVPAFTK